MRAIRIAALITVLAVGISANPSVAASPTPKPVVTKKSAPVLNPITIKQNVLAFIKKMRAEWPTRVSYDSISTGDLKPNTIDIYDDEVRFIYQQKSLRKETFGQYYPVPYVFTPSHYYTPLFSTNNQFYLNAYKVDRLDWIRYSDGYDNFPEDLSLNINQLLTEPREYKTYKDRPVTLLEDAYQNGTKFTYDSKKLEYTITGRTETIIRRISNGTALSYEKIFGKPHPPTSGKVNSTVTIKLKKDGKLDYIYIKQATQADEWISINDRIPTESVLTNPYVLDWDTQAILPVGQK
jgi:hypothetical protein